MSLTPGTRVGSYGIVSPLGVGGMGEVYRAHDTKLNRDVALKILPEVFATDADRLARFRREAQVLASLNHPNIAHLYGFEDAGSVHALVMELVEGPTLADRIAHGPLELAEVLPIAKQIAEALEAAHEQGIVHRDLKPANVKVRDDGAVKVLDFGLAKAFDPAAAASVEAMHSPTLTARATQMGVILGTAAYMSPEQARGRAVDKRADIWAFGAVLYEMLTGERAFQGADITDTLAAVIKDTPKYAALPPTTPRRLRYLIERCLDRDVRTRLRDIGEARVALGALQAGPGDDEAAGPRHRVRSGRLAWTMLGLAAGVAVTALAMSTWGNRPAPPATAARARFQLTLPESVQLPTQHVGSVAISPDGRSIVFVGLTAGAQQLWLRPTDGSDAKLLPGTERGTLPFWSPGSAHLGFFADGRLKRLEISTGMVQTIVEGTRGPGGAAWTRDDVIIFSPRLEGPLFRVPAFGGTPTPLTTLDAASHEYAHMWPHLLPDGRHFVFQLLGLTNAGLYVGSLDSPERTPLIRQQSFDPSAAQYASGHLVYVRNHQLVAHPFDAATLAVTADPFPLADGFGIGGPGSPAFGVSSNGVLVFRPEGVGATVQLTWFGRDGSAHGTVGAPGQYSNLELSPDGSTVAVQRQAEKERSIWLVDVARGTSTRFTTDSYSVQPHWSPNGDRIVFAAVRDTPPNPFIRTLAGAETRLARLPQPYFITTWAPDGNTLLGESIDVRTSSDLWLVSSSADKAPTPFLQTPYRERDARISPDGRWVAFISNESGADEICVTTFPTPGRRVQVSTGGGTAARWRDDGRELFFQSKGKVMAVSLRPAADATGGTAVIGLQVGLPQALFSLPEDANSWTPAKGGARFLVAVQVKKAVPSAITVLLNWTAQGKNPK